MKHIHLPWAFFFVKSGILRTSVYNVYGSQNEFVNRVARVFILRMRSLGQNGPLRRDAVFVVARIMAMQKLHCSATDEHPPSLLKWAGVSSVPAMCSKDMTQDFYHVSRVNYAARKNPPFIQLSMIYLMCTCRPMLYVHNYNILLQLPWMFQCSLCC